MAESTMESQQPLGTLGTSLFRARCLRPALLRRMQDSLERHGQLTAVVVVMQAGVLEVVDGFKRRTAAVALRWSTLRARALPTTEATTVWATMLLLNRGPQSMTELEEALVLRELEKSGLQQVQIAALVQRHKSWVSRRIGLCDRLHPELVEQVRTGLLHPGVARRLIALPQGNQLELAAAACRETLGPRDAERLVTIWHRAPDLQARRALLLQPKEALDHVFPRAPRPPIDPRLTPQGQRLQRLLQILSGMAPTVSQLLRTPLSETERPLLLPDLRKTRTALATLLTALGPLASADSDGASGASDAPS